MNRWAIVFRPGGLQISDTEVEPALGYQSFAGARYQIDDRMEPDGIYKFLGTTDNKLDDLKIEGIRTHTVALSFVYRF